MSQKKDDEYRDEIAREVKKFWAAKDRVSNVISYILLAIGLIGILAGLYFMYSE